MIVDAFTFFNEVDVLAIRLLELDPVVDRFVLVEATTDFRGRARSPIFESVSDRFRSYRHKITHIVVDDLPQLENAWVAEHFQRDAIRRGLDGLAADDIVLVSDVDEIPRRESIAGLSNVEHGAIIALEMDLFYYGLNWHLARSWSFARVATAQTLSWLTPHEVRSTFPTRRVIDAGWHLSYFYRRDQLLDGLRVKATSFAHAEFSNPAVLEDDYLRLCVDGGLSWCSDPPFSIKFAYRDIDGTYPKAVLSSPEAFDAYRLTPEDRDVAAERRAMRAHFSAGARRTFLRQWHRSRAVLTRHRPL